MKIMENLKEEILKELGKHTKNSMKTEDLQKALHMDSSAGFIEISEMLREMEDEWLVIRNENGTFADSSTAGIYTGRISINKKGMGFVDREGGNSVKIDPTDQGEALDGDTVVYKCSSWQEYGRVLKVLKHVHTTIVGTFVSNGKKLNFVPDDLKLQNKIIRVDTDTEITPVDGSKALCSVERYGKVLRLHADKIIGHKDDPGVDILSVLLEHDIVAEFPEEVMEEVNAIPQYVTEEEMKGREDLREEITVTIDGDDSKDFDDAVAVVKEGEGWRLKVSIADVSHYVKEGSALDKEAYLRGCSTYVTDRVVPMLPHELSNGICSLNPQVDRLALTCEMKIEKDGHAESYRVYRSVINSTERMTYNNVNKILEGNEEIGEKYAHLGTLFTDLRDCADAIRKNRVAKGAIDFDTDEAEIKVDENGNPTEIKLRERGHAERMIEDCMIAANVCVANQMKWAQLPCVYRIHEEPEAKRVKNFVNASMMLGHKFITGKSTLKPKEVQQYLESVKDLPEYPVLAMMLLRCMSKAKYDANCVGHFGLAEKEYLHFTSPIRRYPDLIVHRMLGKYVFEGCTDAAEMTKDEALMQDYSEQSSIRERASQDAEYECDDMKKAQYMEQFIGDSFEGLITSVTAFGFYVQLPNTVEGLVHINALNDDYYSFNEDRLELVGNRSRKIYRIGQTVRVTVLAASRETRQIDFGISTLKSERGERGGRRFERTSDRRSSDRRSSRNGEGRRRDDRSSFGKKKGRDDRYSSFSGNRNRKDDHHSYGGRRKPNGRKERKR